MRQQPIVNSSGWFSSFLPTNHSSVFFALLFSALLTACGGGGNPEEVGPSPDGVKDGTPPTILTLSAFNEGNGSDAIEPGEPINVAIKTSESVMKPVVTIDGKAATVSGQHTSWTAKATMGGDSSGGLVGISVTLEDPSGEKAAADTSGVRGKDKDDVPHPPAYFCDEGCSVGPKGTQRNLDFRVESATYTFFDFGPDASNAEVVADPKDATNKVLMTKKLAAAETWAGTWIMTESDNWNSYGTYQLKGKDGKPDGVMSMKFLAPEGSAGANVRLKLENSTSGAAVETDAQITSPGEWETLVYDFNLAADYNTDLTYDKIVVFFDFNKAGTGADQTFYLDEIKHGGITSGNTPPWVGLWKLEPAAGSLAVGPSSSDLGWWGLSEADVTTRACLMDDLFYMGIDGTFKNMMGTSTWLEPWQGSDPEACGTPLAPHDGSKPATYVYDEDAKTIKVTGEGAHLGLAKAVNDCQLGNSDDGCTTTAPADRTYNVTKLAGDGSSMTVQIEAGNGSDVWWQFKFVKVPTPLAGAWKLAPEEQAFAVGATQGDTSWWGNSADDIVNRSCLFNDTFYLGGDFSFANVQGTDTWLEGWQGVDEDKCGTPVAPHNGSGNSGATYSYDADAGTLTIVGAGSHIGLAKVTNQGQVGVADNNTIVYKVSALSADLSSMTLDVDFGGGWWRYKLVKADTGVAGKWKIKPAAGSLAVGPSQSDFGWWGLSEADVTTRACLLDDVFDLSYTTGFSNHPGELTWLEGWQGVSSEQCGAPVAPHDGSGTNFQWHYDLASQELKLEGVGAHVGLPKVVNDCQLGNADDGCTTTAPASRKYIVKSLSADKSEMELHIEAGNNSDVWWKFVLEKQ